jgi:hypothetical protein
MDMAGMRAREAALLTSYGWVEEDAGIARIPIERALELAAEGKAAPKPDAGASTDGGDAPDGGTP